MKNLNLSGLPTNTQSMLRKHGGNFCQVNSDGIEGACVDHLPDDDKAILCRDNPVGVYQIENRHGVPYARA